MVTGEQTKHISMFPFLLLFYLWFRWEDQGWGHRKGRIWLLLMREGTVIANTRNTTDGDLTAPHSWEDRVVKVNIHDVVTKAVRGDVLRVIKNAGGGGGHSLHAKDFHMRVVFEKPIDDNEEDEEEKEKEEEEEEESAEEREE